MKEIEGKLVLQRVTTKGTKKHYLAQVIGPSKEEGFPLDLGFMGEEQLSSPVVFEKVGSQNAAVESFEVKADDIFQTAIKGDRAEFFMVNSKGMIISLDREAVHKSVGAPWEIRSG
jgi:hypothetical protein